MKIRQASIAEVVALSNQIPELINPYQEEEYAKRLTGLPHLILLAEIEDQPVGFKVGYQREEFWYSWMGGVHPHFRRRGIALALAEEQEKWAQLQGYPHVTFKTLNRHQAMLLFAISRGFQIIQVDKEPSVA
ncbi:MAG: GNAT family N-acetyltransferase, partial [Bacteroidota bacterium]